MHTTMKYRSLITIALCSFVLSPGIAWTAGDKPRKPRQTRDRLAEVIPDLTEAGKQLESNYAEQLSKLKTGIKNALPKVDETKQAALLATLGAEAEPAKEVRLKAREVRKIREFTLTPGNRASQPSRRGGAGDRLLRSSSGPGRA